MHEAPGQPAPVEVFISYASKDEKLMRQLTTALASLRREEVIKEEWHGRKILAGADWEKEIDDHINKAQVILLLVSFDFVASDYCFGVEFKRAMERHDKGEALVIPIILHPASWKRSLGRLQALPTDERAVTNWRNRQAALLNIVEGIRDAVKEFNARHEPQGTHQTAPGKAEASAATVEERGAAPTPPREAAEEAKRAAPALKYASAVALIAVAVAVVAGLHFSWFRPSTPSIRIVVVPSYDPVGGSHTAERITGEVSGVSPEDYRVVIYSLTLTTWFVQPTEAEPLTKIGPGGKWEARIHTGVRYAALLVRADYDPRSRSSTHPARMDGVAAWAEAEGRR